MDINILSFRQKFFSTTLYIKPIKNSSCQKVVDAFESRGQIICTRKKRRGLTVTKERERSSGQQRVFRAWSLLSGRLRRTADRLEGWPGQTPVHQLPRQSPSRDKESPSFVAKTFFHRGTCFDSAENGLLFDLSRISWPTSLWNHHTSDGVETMPLHLPPLIHTPTRCIKIETVIALFRSA